MANKKRYDDHSLADLFREIELKLIDSAKRNLSRHEKWEKELDMRWEQWQLSKIRSLNKFRIQNRLILNSYKKEVDDIIDTVLKDSYGQAYNNSIKLADEIYAELDSSTPLDELVEIPEENFFQINDDKLNVVIDEMQKTFSDHNGVIMRKMDDVYRQVVDKAVLEMAAGTTTIQSAIDDATKTFLERGIDSIVYKNGARVNIASYAEMYLRTANQKATFLAQGKVRDRLGVYTVLVSQHANCCEACMNWQNQILIDDVFTSLTKEQAKVLSDELNYKALSLAMSEGLFH